MKKAYYYFFYKLYKLAVSISDDAINEWKPLITILILEILLVVELFIWYSILTKRIFIVNNPLASFLPIVSVIAICNYLFFLHRDKWKSYVNEFENYDKKKKSIYGAIVFFIIALILLSLVIAFYQLSQIDWNKYR